MIAKNPIYMHQQLKLLVCQNCRYVVLSENVGKHLREVRNHWSLTPTERDRFRADIAAMGVDDGPGRWGKPSENIEKAKAMLSLKGLAIVRGYRCTLSKCNHLNTSMKGLS